MYKIIVVVMYAVFGFSFHVHAVIADVSHLATGTNFSKRIEQLFASTHENGMKVHGHSPEREETLKRWLGLNEQGSNSANIADRLSFLEENWANIYFRPFDGIQGGEDYLLKHLGARTVIRLSSSEPGKLTLTFRNYDGRIFHSRYALKGNRIIYSKTEISLADLVAILNAVYVGTYVNCD